MTAATQTEKITRFAYDPVASDSAQFPLACPLANPVDTADTTDGALPATTEPWGLRGMRPGADPMSGAPDWRYDHEQHMAFDDQGRPLHEIHMGMTTTNMDGNDGPSEDWSAKDFAPDMPLSSAAGEPEQR